MNSIILPTYNEAQNIELMIKEVQKYIAYEDEIIVVDDNSPDGTSKLVKELFSQDLQVKLLTRSEKINGLTGAICAGIEMACGDVIIWLDSDLSQPPSKIPEMLEKISQGYDFVSASRYINGGQDARSSAPGALISVQTFLSWLLFKLTHWLIGKPFYDWSSGFIACRAEALKSLMPLRGDYGEYYIDLIGRGFKNNFKICEIPYCLVARERGESKTATNFWGLIKRGRKYLYQLWLIRR